MGKICHFCGLKCKKNNLNEWVCPNCGIIPENIEQENGEDKADYIG